MADNDNRYKLWQTISKEYDLPDYTQFSKDMEDATKRKSLHDAVSAEYDLPDFDQFSRDMGYDVQTTQQGNQNTQNAQNAKKPQQTAQSSHVEDGRGLPSDNGYSKQKTAFDKAASQTWNNLTHQGRVKWTIEGHPEVKMVAVTDDLVKKFPQLEQSRGYQVPFNMSTGTPIMQNIDDKGNIITPDEASEQYTKILTNQDFDYVPKQETASVQIGSVVNTALSTKGGWLDRMARKSMAQYGDDWEHQKFESDGKEVSSSDVFGKVKQTIYDYYNSVLKGIRTNLMFNSDKEKQAYVDNLYKTGQLKEEDIPKANVLHYVQNVDKEEQIEAVRQAKLNRQLELEMAQEKFNQLPQREKGESDFDYNDRILHEGALYEQDIRKLKKQIAQLDAVSDELQGNNTSWKEWGHAFKTSGIGSYHAWDLGATDLKDAIELNKVANGMKRGKQMTSSDYMALRVMLQANEADAIENAVMPVSYKSKKGGFISAPFTFGFFVGGDIAKGLTSAVNKVAGKVISKAVKGAVLKAGGKKALSAATNLAEKAANTKCVKLFGMLAKDFEKAAFMENSTGAATTGAEILNRNIGTVTESDDGFKMEGESLPTAIIKGEISQNIESQTEFLGEHFPSSLKFIRGMAHTKVGSAMGLRNLAAWLTKVSRTDFATTLKSYATRAGINGVFGEYLEEVAGTAENALLVGDQKFSDLLDVKQQEEVAGSVVLSCLGMGIFGTAIYTGQRGLNMPTYYRLKHLQNKWDNAGLDLFTGDEWAKLKDRIDNTPNEGMKSVMADILKADNMTEEQARAAFNYARCSLTLRGMNLGAMKAAQLGLTDDRHIEQDNAYVEGRQAKDEDKHDIQIEFEDRSHELAEKLGISEQQLDNMSDEDLESLTGKDDQLDNLIYDYQTSHAKYQGVVDNADDEIDKAAQEAARQTDMATDKSRGTVRNATIKATKGEEDYGVYIVSGNVATNEDGSINVSESDDMILYYDPKSGKIEHCDAMRLSSLGEEVNAEETRNQAIADAKEKAIRKQAGIIDGTVGEGTSFTITDAEGNEHTYEVLADNGDGSAMITMDGNVQDTPVSLQDLQNLKDAEGAKRLEAAKMQHQQYEEEREKQNAPVEDNLDYADIINTNGNVEIAEVVDEEGNAMFPDAEEVFFVQNQGSRAKVMVLDNEGNLQPKLVKKSSVRTLGTMSVDEYRQERQKTLKEAENVSEPSLVDETEPSDNVVTDNVPTDNTTTDETQPGNEAEVTTSDETQNISNEQESTPKITLEDGTEVPMLEDGNPDFSQLTAGQVAELYDSQFGDDAEQIISGNVNKAKKALDKANGMTVSGGSFAEQKASKKAKDKAIAEAKEKYDSAKAIADAYNERMLAKEEDTPEGRMNLIEKARRKFNRMKGSVKDNAQAIAQLYDETVGALLHRLYDSTGIDVFDDTANTVDEYVASSIAPYSLNYEGTETSKGVKQETGLSRSDFAKTGLLAKEGKGKTIGQLANDLWRDRPSNLENITDQDVRNAIIDLITSGQTAFGLKNHIQNLRIAEAENILEQQKRQADELAHAEKQKEEELASTELADDNTEESSNTEATPADAQEEDKLADMPFEAPSPDEDVPFSAKDKAKDPLEAWNNMTDKEKAAYIENNRVKDTRLVDDVVGKKLRKAIEKIAGMMGATIQWQRTDMIRNGWFNPNTKTVYLALDSSILEGVQFIFGHEMTHEIKSKSPDMYDELKKLVKEKYGEELFEAMTNDNEKRYADVGKTDDDRSYYEEETVADAIGDMINDLNLTRSIALKMSHPLLAKMHDVLLKIKNAFTGTPYSDNVKGIIRTIEMAYVKTANREAVNTATQEGEGGQRLSLREKPAPKKTQKVYKLMRLGEDGKLYPLFIGSGAEVELGKWYDAESPKLQDLTSLSSNDYVGTRTVTINGVDVKEKYNYGAYIVNNETGEAMSLADFKAKYSKEFAKMGKNPNKKAVNWATDNGYRWIKIEEKKQGQSRYGGEARSYYNYGINGSGGVTTFAMRPGWHAGSLPTMRQIGKGSGRNLRDDTFVWVEGEIPADIDYNEEAQKNADKDIPDHIPTDGYYLKATNANKEASQADRVGWYVAGAFKANRIMSDKEARNIIDEWNAAHPDEEKVEYDWKRESGKDFNAETMSLDGAPKFSLKVYHGSGADFTEFDFDHMGEGAGSQSFGWGGYVTSSKKIGKSYADLNRVRNLPEDIFDTENKKAAASYVQKLITQGYDKESAIQEVRSKYDGFLDNLNHDDTSRKNNGVAILNLKERIATLDEIEEGKLSLPTVSLYEVDIPDDNGSNYLEWEKKPSNEVATKIIEGIYGLDDKTLDDMAARDIVLRTLMYDYIKNADKKQMIPILVKTNGLTRNTVYDNGNVEDDMRFVYNRLSNWMGSPKAASKFLSSLGFTGIKYPAGTIYGGAEEGDVNYVIFKPEDMQIVEHEKFSVKEGINRGYTQRENGDKISKNAYEAEEDGTYSHGTFKRKYKVAARTFPLLQQLGFITNTEWHHTGRNFSKTGFYTWADSDRISGGSISYADGKTQSGSIAAKYKENKQEIDDIVKGLPSKQWEFTKPESTEPLTYEAWLSRRIPFREEDYLSKEEQAEKQANHERISADKSTPSYYRGESHKAVDQLYYNVAREHYQKELEDNRQQHEAEYKQYESEFPSKMQKLKEQNLGTNGKEKDLMRIYDLLGYKDSYGQVIKEISRPLATEDIDRVIGDGEKFSLRLQDAINETDTEPTEAQKKSGNYKKGHVKFGGYDYTIENPKGSYRSGVDENGKEWKQKMNDTYGYIRGKFGKDGDHLDMFINDKADLDSWNGDVYVVDQVNQDGTFDEHKVMYGYDSLEEAKKAYLSNYEKGWTGLGNITPVSKADFDKWLDKSNRKLKPFADYADITSKTNMDTAPSSFEEFLEHPAVEERASLKDAEYLEAVRSGDMEKAQKMVYDAARAAGYVNGTEYQGEGSWNAPSASVEKKDFANLDALRESVEEYSGDTNVYGIINGVTTNDDDFYYNPGRVGFRDAAASETSSVLRRLRYDKADANTKVKVYRTVPTDVKGNNLMSGDWIALSKQYCIKHGNGRYGEGGYRIIEEKVPIKTIWNDGNDMREFGFDDGNNNEAEKNVPNNRKLLDAVTYDNNGNVIPLSERFNESNDDIRYSLKNKDRKQAQLDIILKTNPMLDDYHTGIRKVEDIKTLGESVEEARSEAEKYGDDEWSAYPDITNDMLQNALETGEITIYSSKPIKNGVFVTPSYMQASDYAGGGNVYEKTVPLNDVAWINTDEGQYAKVDGERYSLRVDRYRDELNQWKKDNNLPKDAERPQLPVREANESAADFLKRVKEYRKQAALWATAPKYEDHLLVSDTAQGQFNLEMQRKAVLTRIVIQDSMLAIRKAQEAIMKEKGVDKLNPAEDAYTAENRSHGKAKNEFEEYNDEFLQPLRKAYNNLMQRLGKSYDNVKVYMIAKHGLERNAYIAFKYALDEDYETNEERMNAYNNYKADMDRLNNDADFEAGRIDFAAWKQRDGFIRTKYAPSYFKFRFDENGMTKDYSGLSALFDADDYESAAADLVKEVEDANPYYTDELWYATNDATKKILRDSYNAGMMTEDNFNFVSGMYRNYIPLRGWGDTNADQVWNYVGGGKGAFNQVVKEAKGRKSLADDPIAYIENMAESAILMNNRNWVKQHLLLLAQNHRTSLLNVSKAWYIKTKDSQGNEEWIPASPQITEGMTGRQVETALDAFEQKMEQMQQNGEATQKREHLEISYPQTNGEEREHEVRVMKGGEEYVIYVNGDPQLAQAMNNTRARKVREGIEESRPQRFLARTGRYMAAAYTSMSPLFIPSNYMRDLTMTLASTAIREDARYNYLLRRNMLKHWNTFPMVLSYQNGTLREKVRNGSASRVEQMFYDFMMNGGETGFVTSVDVEDLKKKFRNDLKDLNRMAANPKKVGHIIMNSIETLNRAIEDSNRFMVYMTSIECGRSIEEAVNNAKDVTLNFNRKGTGEHGWQAVRDMYLFINPAVQSLQTLGALAKHHPFKFTAVTTGWLATGLLVPMLNNLLMSFFGGDDDKDKYWQFTKWDRRNNFIMWIPFTKEFVKIPLAQEFRGFYGVGDMIASKLWGGEKAEESWGDYALDLAGQIVDMLPLDPTGYDGNIGLAITPNGARPIGELALNVDFTGKPIFKNSEYNKYDPNFTKAYVGTPDWLVRISKMVNSIDNKYPDVEQNAIDRFGDPKFNPNNPAVIDHLLSSYLGGSYTMGSQIIGVATKALNGDDIKMADIPLASKFVSNPDDRPVSKKQGEEFWDMKERHDRAANTLSKLKKKAKVDGDYSTLDIFFGSDEYRQYKEDDKKVKKYEEDRKKEKAQETGEAYRPHKTTADDVYKSHTTPKDDFEDMKMKQLYEKLNSYKIRYEAIDGISGERGDAYYKANKAAIDAIEEIAYDKSQIASIKKGFLSDGQNTYDADGMKDIRELRKRILDVLEKANKAMMNNRK